MTAWRDLWGIQLKPGELGHDIVKMLGFLVPRGWING